jgi:glycosyltransferase involved in cell wall biosynthesis
VSSRINGKTNQLGRRFRQILGIWKKDGIGGFIYRARGVVSSALAPANTIFLVRPSDVMAANLSVKKKSRIPAMMPGERLTVNWVTTPPARGSGGHTTLFRIVRCLEERGFENRIYFYDVYDGDHRYYAEIVRDYYGFHGTVANIDEGMKDAHAIIATAWQSAYPIFNAACAGKRFYLVQDFEPDFYPAGSLRLFADNTYRMGFHGLSIGRCFAERLRSEFGMTVDTFKYGCDASQYHRIDGSERTGIVFYARRETARRGFELGLMAIQVFAERRPDVEIHIYGDKIGKLPFDFIDHGHITPAEINSIYNRCYAGLSLSFTNVSLVALEMLAAGCIPVVNDTELVRTDLNNPFARYTPAYPHALAGELDALTRTADFASISAAASESVRSVTWDTAGDAVNELIRNALRADVLAEANQMPVGDATAQHDVERDANVTLLSV